MRVVLIIITDNKFFTRTIIRYRVAATLRQPQIKQDTASNKGEGLQNQRDHHIILTKYDAVHSTAVSET